MQTAASPPTTTTQAQGLHTRWGLELKAGVCERCDWGFLFPGELNGRRCPHCFQASLSLLTSPLDQLAYPHPPELVLPFSLSGESLAQKILSFARDIRFAPADLTPENLIARLEQIYLPMWLVDVQVVATWQAEVGFDYQVVSHQGRFSEQGGWATQEVTETRTRWEPRLGRLERAYENLPAPALEVAELLKARLGEHHLKTAQPFQAQALSASFVRLPDRAPEDAWPAAVPALQAAAAQECRQAAGADHLRQFRWSPEFPDRNWTLLLMPAYTTFYLDDAGNPQAILIHGQTGRLVGARRASMKRAQRTALIIGSVAMLLFLISLVVTVAGVALPGLLPLGGAGLLAALAVGMSALLPLWSAWSFNRGQPAGWIDHGMQDPTGERGRR